MDNEEVEHDNNSWKKHVRIDGEYRLFHPNPHAALPFAGKAISG